MSAPDMHMKVEELEMTASEEEYYIASIWPKVVTKRYIPSEEKIKWFGNKTCKGFWNTPIYIAIVRLGSINLVQLTKQERGWEEEFLFFVEEVYYAKRLYKERERR